MMKENFVSMRAGVWEDTGIKQCFGTFISNFYLTLLESVLNDSLDTCPLTETPRSLFVTLTEEKSNKSSECFNPKYYRVHSHEGEILSESSQGEVVSLWDAVRAWFLKADISLTGNCEC